MGKTRLAAELTASCAADGTRVLCGGCVPVGDGALPYAAIVTALRPLPDDLGVATGPSRRSKHPSCRDGGHAELVTFSG